MKSMKKFSSFSDLKEVLKSEESVQESTPHELPPPETSHENYYGERKTLSNDNDVNCYPIGGVFYLPDNFATDVKTYHPYILVDNTYVDKRNVVPMFKITSSSSIIDLVPIVMNGTISYIYPYEFNYIPVDVIKSEQSKFIGDISKSDAFRVALNKYMAENGLKSREESDAEFSEYVDKFNAKHKDKEVYQHKNGESKNYKFMTFRDIPEKPQEKPIEDKISKEEPVVTPIEETPVVPKVMKTTKKSSAKETIEIFWQSQAMMASIAAMESLPKDKIKLPVLEKMTVDEIKIFLAYKENYTIDKTAKFYNCSKATISNRYVQIRGKYNLKYRV